tara:strand:- start:271 stop:663 length:393 start_codon:yes stop_codon:yes gene_type:complete
MKLSQVATIIPLIIVAIGLIGWILTLRNDVTSTVEQLDGIHEQISDVHVRIDSDTTESYAIMDERFIEAMDQITKLQEEIVDLEKSLLVADDQMKTIMGDHMGFNGVLQELGKSGLLPSGERRSYGGYGN